MGMRLPKLVLWVGVGLASAVALPRRAAAADPAAGPELALRVGYGIPTGNLQSGTSLDSYVSSTIPLVLEGGYRVDSSLFLGLRFQYAFANLKDPNALTSCGNNASCDGSVTTLGLEGIYRFVPDQTFAPWVGLGGGYEWASADYTRQNVNGDVGVTNKGFQAMFMLGGDVRVNDHLVLGPSVEAQLGRYDNNAGHVRAGNFTMSTGGDITNTAWHTWIVLGVRGAYGF
jgi:hypothetical protein